MDEGPARDAGEETEAETAEDAGTGTSASTTTARETPPEDDTTDDTVAPADDGTTESTDVADDPATGDDSTPEPDAGDATGEEARGSAAEADADADATEADAREGAGADAADVPPEIRKYDRFKKIDGSTYDRANEFLRERTYITAREWAIARLCADFRTETGVEMTKIGENLPELVPFMTDTYSPQAVNQARASFEEKVRMAGATFLYGAMCDFFTAEELDDVMYEATEVAKFLLEVEGVELSVEEELEAEDEISSVMREVREHSAALRHDEIECPDCGHHFEATAADAVDGEE